MKKVPVKLERHYQFVHSLTSKPKQSDKERLRKKNLSYGGVFNYMSNKDRTDFLIQTKKTRSKLFDRNINLRQPQPKRKSRAITTNLFSKFVI